MAKKRMFSLDIIDTDAFMDMPSSSQNLYFHLGMRADDDGFIASPKRIVKNISASEDDFKVLQSKGYVIPFPSGVCVITDWKQNNYIQKDRYTPTRYQEERKMLGLAPDKTYVLLDTPCIQDASKLDTQSSRGKVSIDKNSIDKEVVVAIYNTEPEKTSATAPTVQENLSEIAKLYEQEIGVGTVTPLLMDDLKYYLDVGLEKDLIIECIGETSKSGKKSFKYMESILRRCRNQGIRTAKEFKEDQKKMKQKPKLQPKKQPSGKYDDIYL